MIYLLKRISPSSNLKTLINEKSNIDENEINIICENLKQTLDFFSGDSNQDNDPQSLEEQVQETNGDHLACSIPDFVEELHNYRRVGLGISESEGMKIWIAMRTLVEKYESRIKKIRFWGKIFGKEEDYYIIETEMEQVEEEDILEVIIKMM